MHHKWLLVTLIVLGFAEVATCEVGETVVLKAQLKLLQGKIDRQARELKALHERVEQLKQTNARLKGLCDKAGIDTKVAEDRDPPTKPDRSTPGAPDKPSAVRSIPVNIRQVLIYASQRTEAAKKEKMAIGRTKVIDDALVKIKSMLSRGPITLTYRVINVDTRKEGEVELKVGYPKEVLDACVAAKTLTRKRAASLAMSSNGTVSIIMSSKQALTVRKGAKLILRGKAKLYERTPPSGFPKGTVVVFRQAYGWPWPVKSFIRTHYLLMEDFTFTLNGKKVESVK